MIGDGAKEIVLQDAQKLSGANHFNLYRTSYKWENNLRDRRAIGVGLGIFAGEGMALLAVKIAKIVPEWPAVIFMQWVVISVSFSAVIGISFGLYPAIKAASLSPIEALRAD